MMFFLLKLLRTVPLTAAAIETFLLRTAKLMVIGEITKDDLLYLIRLIRYRITEAKQKGE